MRTGKTIMRTTADGLTMLLLLVGNPASAGQWSITTASGQKVQIAAEESRGGARLFVERRQADGKPDPRFGVRGRVPISLGPDNEPPAGLALDDAGRVIVIGATQSPAGARLPVVLRLLPAGDPDPTWSVGGVSTEAPAPGNARALDALPLRDGRMLVVGTVEVNGVERAAAWHLRADGRLDTSAARPSRFVLASQDASRAVSLTLLNDGQVMLGVRVLTDADMMLEGHSFDPGDADATPMLVTRQPWPPAWSDAPVWLPIPGSPRWADPARPESVIAAVKVDPAASAVPWKSLAPDVVVMAAAPRALGDASINPLVDDSRPRAALADAGADASWWAWLAVGASALTAAAVYTSRRAQRRAREAEEHERRRSRHHDY